MVEFERSERIEGEQENEPNTSENKMETAIAKQDIIPEEWKDNIDEIILQELVGANRYFAQSNKELSKLIERQADKTPEDFIAELKNRWDWHNRFYENLLEPALPLLLEKRSFDLSPLQVEALIEVYKSMAVVDRATLIVSGAIKKHLDKWIPKLSQELRLSDEENQSLKKLPEDSFWAKYHADHLRYLTVVKESPEKAETLKRALLEKYHLGDERIFEGRMRKFSRYSESESKELRRRADDLTMSESEKTQQFYLTLERPRLKAVHETLVYDNVTEYQMITNLVGISGFILRRRIIEYLNEAKVIRKEGGIYDFSDEEIVDGLEKLLAYRKEVLHKEVPHYGQTDDSCGAVCLMSALNYFNLSGLDKKTEDVTHHKVKSSYTSGDYFSKMALEAGKRGLDTTLIHSEKDMFHNRENFFPPDLYQKLIKEYGVAVKEAEQNGVRVLNGTEVSTERIREYLEDDSLVILAGYLGNNILHSILLSGYNPEGFVVMDPLKSKRRVVSQGYIERFSETPIGSWMIVIRKNHGPLMKLLQEAPKFIKEGEELLGIDNDS